MTVIATDGHFIEPEMDVSSITVTNSERYDFILDTAGKEERTYTMRFGSEPDCDLCRCVSLASVAFLRYGGSAVDQQVRPDYLASVNVPGRHVNPLPERTLPADHIAVAVPTLREHDRHVGRLNCPFPFPCPFYSLPSPFLFPVPFPFSFSHPIYC